MGENGWVNGREKRRKKVKEIMEEMKQKGERLKNNNKK